jgi:hypothetical protein
MKASERAWPMVGIVCATVLSWHALDRCTGTLDPRSQAAIDTAACTGRDGSWRCSAAKPTLATSWILAAPNRGTDPEPDRATWEHYAVPQAACRTILLRNGGGCIPPGRYPHMAWAMLEQAEVMTDVTVDGDTVIVGAPK